MSLRMNGYTIHAFVCEKLGSFQWCLRVLLTRPSLFYSGKFIAFPGTLKCKFSLDVSPDLFPLLAGNESQEAA